MKQPVCGGAFIALWESRHQRLFYPRPLNQKCPSRHLQCVYRMHAFNYMAGTSSLSKMTFPRVSFLPPRETFDWSALSQPAGGRKEGAQGVGWWWGGGCSWTVIGSSLAEKSRQSSKYFLHLLYIHICFLSLNAARDWWILNVVWMVTCWADIKCTAHWTNSWCVCMVYSCVWSLIGYCNWVPCSVSRWLQR